MTFAEWPLTLVAISTLVCMLFGAPSLLPFHFFVTTFILVTFRISRRWGCVCACRVDSHIEYSQEGHRGYRWILLSQPTSHQDTRNKYDCQRQFDWKGKCQLVGEGEEGRERERERESINMFTWMHTHKCRIYIYQRSVCLKGRHCTDLTESWNQTMNTGDSRDHLWSSPTTMV